jgi:hypothetical protein
MTTRTFLTAAALVALAVLVSDLAGCLAGGKKPQGDATKQPVRCTETIKSCA